MAAATVKAMTPEAVAETAELLARSKSPVVIAGVEIHRRGLQQPLLDFIEQTNLPIAATLTGKSVIRERHPNYLGIYSGALSNDDARRVVEDSDCILMLGMTLNDIDTGGYTIQLNPQQMIRATQGEVFIRHHRYPGAPLNDFLGRLSRQAYPRNEQLPAFTTGPEATNFPEKDRAMTIARLIGRLNATLTPDMMVVCDTGDCLFAHSLKLASEFPTTDVCRAVSTATRNVCSGEIIQNNRKGDLQLAEEQYFELIRMKTGELFALACELGGSLAGADAEETQALRRYGMALGTAYQIYDDCLDLFGAEETAGKSLGTDIAGGKATLPVLLLQQQAGLEMTTKLKQMVGQWDENQLNILQGWLSEFNTLEQSQCKLEAFLVEARESLEVIEESAHRDVLEVLTRFLAQQSAQLGVS